MSMVEGMLPLDKSKRIKTNEIIKTFEQISKENGKKNDELQSTMARFETTLDNAKVANFI